MGPVRGVALHNGDGEASSADSESEEAEHGSASEAAGSGGSGDSEGSDEADSASSDSEGSENVGRGVRLNAEAAAESDEDESSASWSSEEGDDENEGDLNSMAQNMLAALQSMDGRRPAAIGTALEAAHSGPSLYMLFNLDHMLLAHLFALRWQSLIPTQSLGCIG